MAAKRYNMAPIFTLRPYQQKLEADIYAAWRSGARNVLAVLPTGGGKTVAFTSILAQEQGYSVAIAHRKELVGQMSLALNKRQVPHFAIAPEATIRWIVGQHILEHGQSFYNPSAHCAVAGVDTIMSRSKKLADWGKRVDLWIQDEAHHCLSGKHNKWGKAIDLFPNARGLGVTATPTRADGKGLGRHSDGLMDTMVIGPSARELIDEGYLTDYRIFAPPSDIDMTGVSIGSTGDYSQPQMIKRVKQSRVVGDVVAHYLRLAAGKLGLTFVPSVEIASDMTAAFKQAGVPAEMVSAKTPDAIRADIVRRYRNRNLLQLVNVDIFGEGFDLPAIEVVSFARPTESFVLFCQQFGRALRPLAGKEYAIVIDHVGNTLRHGLPDAPREWTLDARERRSQRERTTPLRTCPSCTGVYEAFYKICPYCHHRPVPANRSAPEFVDGDLTELTPEVLAALRGQVNHVNKPHKSVQDTMLAAGAPFMAAAGAAKQHRLRQEAQEQLRDAIALWAGWQRHLGRDDSESYRRFYYRFGTDVLSAQTLGRPDAERLTAEINKEMGR